MENQPKQTINRLFTIALLCLFTLSAISLHAQNSEIRGKAYDKKTGEALIFTKVVLLGTGKGAVTDVNGIYHITKLPEGTYNLSCTTLGYDTFTTTIVLTGSKIVTQNIFLNPSDIQMHEVSITKDKTLKETRVEISKVEITAKQIQAMPSVGGEPDLAQYLQVLPGVVSTGDQGGQLYIRGGSPVENKVLLDGMTVYNPFHSIGLFSVFDPDIIRNVDVYTGGFDASYGDRISAIVDVTTKDGDQGHFGGKVSAGPFVSKLELEGPLKKFSETSGGSSFMFSGRTSYLQQTGPLLYSYANTNGNGLPYNFTDLYGKLSFNAPGGSYFDLFGFDFSDKVNYPNAVNFNWNSYGAGGKFLLIPASSASVIGGHFSYSYYDMQQQDPDAKPRYSSIGSFEGGLDFTYYPGKDQIKYGFDLNGFTTNYDYFNAANREITEQQFSTELDGYIKYNKVLNRLVLDPSFRVQYYASLAEASFEPRMGAKYVLTDWLRLKAAGGFYSQNLVSAQSDRDVVNLFYGYLASPEISNLPTTFNGQPVSSRLQKSRDAVAGFEMDLGKNVTANVETYYKKFNQLININDYLLFPDIQEFASEPQIYKQDFIVEQGKSYGIDFQMTYDKNPYYFWVTYSLMKVTRTDEFETYSPNWDRRHTINLLGAYQFGKNKSWELSARFTYGSGLPFTKTKGFYDLNDFQNNGISTNYVGQNGNLGILYSDLNTGRLSAYHRLDISLKKNYNFKHRQRLQIVASVTNAYNRANVFYFDRTNYTRINQLPIMPALTLNYSF
jgi:hypothetical protein